LSPLSSLSRFFFNFSLSLFPFFLGLSSQSTPFAELPFPPFFLPFYHNRTPTSVKTVISASHSKPGYSSPLFPYCIRRVNPSSLNGNDGEARDRPFSSATFPSCSPPPPPLVNTLFLSSCFLPGLQSPHGCQYPYFVISFRVSSSFFLPCPCLVDDHDMVLSFAGKAPSISFSCPRM